MKKRTAIQVDLTAHIMTKVADAAADVAQLADTSDEVLSLYTSAMAALLSEVVLRTAPPGTSRAEMLLGAKGITRNLPRFFATFLEDLTDDELEEHLKLRKSR